MEIAMSRLYNQQIAASKFDTVQELAGWMAAMQAQDFAMAKWALGLRLPATKDTDIEEAFNDGSILRTHMLRPTWHFVTPRDIRWMLALVRHRVNAANAYYYRKFELDAAIFRLSNHTLTKALEGGNQLTRAVLKTALEQAGLRAEGLRLGYILMHAELDGLICSGPRLGRQFTYALLEERVPPAKILAFDEAMGALCRRYFASRGPATVGDFTNWSGFTAQEVKAGLEMIRPDFSFEMFRGKEYIFIPTTWDTVKALQTTFLMPDYDEYGMSYKDRSALFMEERSLPDSPGEGAPSYHSIVIDGVIKGTWQQEKKRHTVEIRTSLFTGLDEREKQNLEKAILRYKEFNEAV